MARRVHKLAIGDNAVWVGTVAVAAGVGVVLAGPSPTESRIVDAGFLVVAVAFCVAVVATAPWTARWRATRLPIAAAVAMGIIVQVVSRLGDVWRFGVSAAIAIVPLGLLTLVAVEQRWDRRRMRLRIVLGSVLGAAILALVGLGAAAEAARPDLTLGADAANEAIRSLKSGDFAAARQGFQLAAGLLGRAGHELSAPWAQPARLVPVAAQYRRAAVDLTASAQSVSTTIAGVLGEIDFDRLRVVNGAIDVEAISALRDPLARLTTALNDLDSSIAAVDSPWLIPPIRARLVAFSNQIDDQQADGARAMIAVQRVPAMLGADGKRVYLIAFTTPAEARGSGGFMDGWAEVTIDKGHISVTAFGRALDLAVDGDTEHWTHITSSPHFPDVAKSIADGYRAFSGHQVDGVIAMDVETVAALMTLTGPIELSSIGRSISADDAAKFLLSDQYSVVQDPAQNIDLLVQVAPTTIGRLLTSSLPAPPDLIKLLSPYSAQGRLVGWSSHADEEDLLERIQMSGELPTLGGGDGLAVVTNNTGNNKIDYYLTSKVAYAVDTDPTSGKLSATLDITMHNAAEPGVTDPPIVFANTAGEPPGTDVMNLSVYSALAVTGITVHGQAKQADNTSTSHGFNVTSLDLDVAPGATLEIQMQLSGSLDLTHGYRTVIRSQASANATQFDVSVDGDPAPGSPYMRSGIVRINPGAAGG